MNTIFLLAGALACTPPAPATRIHTASRARRRLRIGPFIPVAVGVFMAVFLLVGRLTIAVAALIAAATLVHQLESSHQARRAQRWQQATATLLGHVVADLNTGATMAQAMTHAAEEIEDAAPQGFSDTVTAAAAHTRRGHSGARVLIDAPDAGAELGVVGKIWELAETRGLALAGLMDQARERLDARTRHRAATSASLQGPQATAVILALLPVAGIVMGAAMGANPLAFLFGGGLGGLLLVVGVAFVCAGFSWSRVIITKAAA